MSDKTGGPAFHIPANEYAGHGPEPGMTLRDYFAAKALPAVYEDAMSEFAKNGCPAPGWRYFVAKDAYAMADAMLEARAK